MKRITLIALALALSAAPAFAISGSQLPRSGQADQKLPDMPPSGTDESTRLEGGEEQPTQPVPEPGTIALAALSALALGAAARKRRA